MEEEEEATLDMLLQQQIVEDALARRTSRSAARLVL
jgi:hypothetical protein